MLRTNDLNLECLLLKLLKNKQNYVKFFYYSTERSDMTETAKFMN